MCFFANFWGDFVIVNAFSVLLFCEYLFANGRNDIWSSRGEWMWDVAIQLKSNWEFLLSWIAKQPLCGHCFAAARNDRFVIIDIYVLRYRYICVEVQIYMCWGTDIYVLRYRYICVAPPLCIIFLSSLTKQKKKSWQFRTSLLIWLIIYCIFHT